MSRLPAAGSFAGTVSTGKAKRSGELAVASLVDSWVAVVASLAVIAVFEEYSSSAAEECSVVAAHESAVGNVNSVVLGG